MVAMADDHPTLIIVELKGKRITVSGEVARVIAYLAEYASFFNDKRTTGNFLLLAKEGHLDTKHVLPE